MRLGQRDQVANSPGDHIAVSLQVAGATLVGTEHSGDITRDRRFLGQYRDGAGFMCVDGGAFNLIPTGGEAGCCFGHPRFAGMRETSVSSELRRRGWRSQSLPFVAYIRND